MSAESHESAPVPRNRLVALEGGDYFSGFLMRAHRPEGMSESRKQRIVCKYNILGSLYEHYAKEWATQRGKVDRLTKEEVAERTAYISSISPDDIATLLRGWRKDWGESDYAQLDEEDKIAIDAADDLITEIESW